MMWLFRKICSDPALSLLTALVAAASCLLTAALRPACADAYTYGTGASRTVNAGILLLDETTPLVGSPAAPSPVGPDNTDPYVFNVLNERTDIRPFGWTIVNPLAPTNVTGAIQTRWDARSGNSTAYQIGQNITPAMAPYWEVSLSTASSDDLAQFDILLINLIRPVSFTVADSEKLRRFVDGGGTLWIENSGPIGGTAGGDVNGGTKTPYGPLFFELSFNNPSSSSGTTNYATITSVARNPIISTPYQLSEAELSSLGDKDIGDYYSTAVSTSVAPGPGFTTVIGNSGHSNLPVIAAAQFGAGQVIVTCTGSANTINNYVGRNLPYGTFGYNSGPYSGTSYTNAPSQDLKLLSDIISASDAHHAERQNSHQTGSAVNALSSAARSWNDTNSASNGVTAVSGAAIDGHIAYVTGADGVLRAYDIYPAEDLDGDGNPNDGDTSTDVGASFDLLWQATIGSGASAPTVAVNPTNDHTVVLVEDNTGQIHQFDTTAATSFTGIPSQVSTLGTQSGAGTFTGPAPAPTFYGGRVYAGRPDGTMLVYDFNAGASASSGQVYTPSGAGNEAVTAPPTVGLLPFDSGGNGSDIVAFLPTNTHLYSIYLGARGEQLGGTFTPFSTKLKNTALIDISAVPAYRTYTLNNGLPLTANLTPSGKQFTGTPTSGTAPYTIFSDYDSSFGTGTSTPTNPQSLTRSTVGIGGSGIGTISAPALDGHGNAYYISNESGRSSLSSFHDAATAGNVTLNWRFQLPKTTDPTGSVRDADGVDYTATALSATALRDLRGFVFVGAPVIDDQGFVYAMATYNGQTAVLCFNGLGTVSADIFAPGTETNVSGVKLEQTDPASPSNDLFGNPSVPIQANQYAVGGTGHIDFRSFGSVTSAGGTTNVSPDLVEPYPIAVIFNAGDGNNTGAQQIPVGLHTNLSWYTILPPIAGAVNASGFTKVGNRLFFVSTNGVLESVVADPAAEGFTIGSKYVPPTQSTSSGTTITMFTPYSNAGVGAVAGVPAASNGAIILNGSGGVSAYTNQVTLVVDSNRVLEMDSAGEPQWAVDSTTKTALVGDTTPVYSGGSGQLVTTTLELNRPTALTQLTQNDYLVADTGNNRCVRFDRSGKVIWELTKFTDPNNLLTPGEPDTLNQPTSVQIFSRTVGTNTFVQYLISDTGNFRVVEIDDEYDSTGKPVLPLHQLGWTSRTHDTQGRSYRYQSAAYYYSPSGNQYVVALATNSRIGPPAAQPSGGAPAASNQDASGGSIVLLYYTPPGTTANATTDGTIAYTISDFYADLSGGAFDLATAAPIADPTVSATGVVTQPAQPITVPNGATLLHIRNPRYLKVYIPGGASSATTTNPARNYLIADDNGIFDLVQAKDASGNTAFLARWGFTQTDYQNIQTPIDLAAAEILPTPQPFSRLGIPFIPASVQLLSSTDTVNGYQIGRYLITNPYSQGEAANTIGDNYGQAGYIAPGFGGEVFEVDHNGSYASVTNTYSGHTLSRPSNTSPLSQPAFAYRLQ